MTLTTSLVHDVINYLVTQCNSSAALGGASPPVLVIDGPTAAGEPLTAQQQMWIGFDAVTGGTDAASATQKWPFLGTSGAFRDETGAVTCTAQAWSGDLTPATSRAVVKTMVGAVENMLRGYPPAGPGDSSMGGLVQWSAVDGPFNWTQSQDNNGFSAMCVFRVTYFARLPPS
jgi:hypothetical protein